MKQFWIGPEFGYHGGDQLPGDVECQERPGVNYDPDGAGGWTVNLAGAQDTVWQAIKAIRDFRKLNGGYKVVVGGVDKWFESDPDSRTQQIGLVLAGAQVNGIEWKTFDNSFVTMSQTLAGQIFSAALASDTAIFAVAETHRLAMLASQNPLTYDYTTSWPTVWPGYVPPDGSAL